MIRRVLRVMLPMLLLLTVPLTSFGAFFLSVTIAPPLLPVYVQPVCPGLGYIWVPGYWAYNDFGYYWVPGTWVRAPFVGAFWTPGYWGWADGSYVWHEGFWGPEVGFYGGVDYGFGYFGVGYVGGYWNNGTFFYNQTVNNINTTIINNVYRQSVNTNAGASRVSFNLGTGGTTARPTPAQLAAGRARHDPPTAPQMQLRRIAATDRAQLASVNHGRPSTMAIARTTEFMRHGGAPMARDRQTNAASVSHQAPAARPMTTNRMTNNRPNNAPTNRTPVPGMTTRSGRSPQITPHGNIQANHAPLPTQRVAPHGNLQAHHSLAAPHYSARNIRPVSPAAPHNRVPAQHTFSRSNSAPRRAAPPPSHFSAHNNPVPAARPHYSAPPQHMAGPHSSGSPQQHMAAPHPSAPQHQSAEHPAHQGGTPRGREGGRS
jgi:hypothetical protein